MTDDGFADPALAALYDLSFTPEDRDDFAFYLPMIMAADSVLDVGCGTGILLHLARQSGHTGRLTGLDPAAKHAGPFDRTVLVPRKGNPDADSG